MNSFNLDVQEQMAYDYVVNLMTKDYISAKYKISGKTFEKFVKDSRLFKLRQENERLKRYDEFIKRGIEKHGNKFDYSKVKNDFKNYRTNVTIILKENNKEFQITPELHLRYKDGGVVKVRKPVGYYNNKNNCENEAKKYRNKWEFNRKSSNAYFHALKNGWLDEFSDKYYKEKIVVRHDGNERINVVYSYEFVINGNSYVYVGRTNSLRKRDKSHRLGYLHSNGNRTYDIVYKFAKENNIDIPKVKVLKDNLNLDESQYFEDYFIKEYKERKWNILNKAKTGIGVGSLGSAIQKWTHDECKKIAEKCKSRNELKHSNQSVYQVCLRKGYLNEFFGDSKKKPNGWWDVEEHCQNEALKYRNAKEMSKKCGSAYQHAKKHGWKLIFKKN